MHIGVLYEDRISPSVFEDLGGLVSVDGLEFRAQSKPSVGIYAGAEWLMPTALVVYVVKPYFESFLKEMGKDHYGLVKQGLKQLYEKVAGPKAPIGKYIATAGKLREQQPYSLFFSVVAEAPDGVQLKLLVPRVLERAEYEEAIERFLELVSALYAGSIDPETAKDFQHAPIVSNTLLITYESQSGRLVPIDPMQGRRSGGGVTL